MQNNTGLSLTTSLSVIHKNAQMSEQLGGGLAIGGFINYENRYVGDEQGNKIPDPDNEGHYLTDIVPVLYYNVVWENERTPSLVEAAHLEWINAVGITDTDDDDIDIEELQDTLTQLGIDEDTINKVMSQIEVEETDENDDEFTPTEVPVGHTVVSAPATDQ